VAGVGAVVSWAVAVAKGEGVAKPNRTTVGLGWIVFDDAGDEGVAGMFEVVADGRPQAAKKVRTANNLVRDANRFLMVERRPNKLLKNLYYFMTEN
jgi:hypothetical protein